MKELFTNQESVNKIVEDCYNAYRQKVYAYIFYKLGDAELAQDLTQDVFLHLMEYDQLIRPESARNMVYTVSRNIVYDYLRRHYRRMEYEDYVTVTADEVTTTDESRVVADDIAQYEQKRIGMLPTQRRKVYEMVRFEEKNVAEVADELHLSVRTVENHLLISRREVREYVRRCIG